MKIFNDLEGENIFNMAIKSKNTKKIMKTMKGFNGMPKKEYNDIAESIPLKDLIEQKNNFVEPLIANSMVPAFSDRFEEIKSVFSMTDDETWYAESSQKSYDE